MKTNISYIQEDTPFDINKNGKYFAIFFNSYYTYKICNSRKKNDFEIFQHMYFKMDILSDFSYIE